MSAYLHDAIVALEEDRPEDALDALLLAWRAKKSAFIAEPIRLLGEHFRAARSLPKSKTVAEYQEQWLAVERLGAAADLTPLLDGWTKANVENVTVRVNVLARREADPRLSEAVARGVEQKALPRRVRMLITRTLGRWADPATRPILQRAAEDLPTFTKMVAALPAEPALEDEELRFIEQLMRLVKAAPAPGPRAQSASVSLEQSLLDAVYADPADDDARRIYADFLLGRNDPRGEFIALQLRAAAASLPAAAQKRMDSLQRTHHTDLLGPLAAALPPSATQFRRGFPAVCVTRFKTGTQRETLSRHPAWATVEELSTDEPALVRNNVLRGLKSLKPSNLSALAGMVRQATPLVIEQLEVPIDGQPVDVSVRDAYQAGHAILAKTVRVLVRVWRPMPWQELLWLLQAPVCRRAEQIELLVPRPMSTLHEWCEHSLSARQRLMVDGQLHRAHITPIDDGCTIELSIKPSNMGLVDDRTEMDVLLQGVAPDTHRLRVRFLSGVTAPREQAVRAAVDASGLAVDYELDARILSRSSP